jgi:hypothetical protein
MKIVICSSIDFTYEIKGISDKLVERGHVTELPLTSERILKGELTMEEFKTEKQKSGDGAFRKIKDDVIRKYYEKIKNADAIPVANYDKKGIANYIGGNTFLEMGFAHVLNKKIYVLNDIPEISYKDEILAMNPILLNGNIEDLK